MAKSFWFLGMAGAAIVGGIATFTYSALFLFLLSTACVLLFGHSLGSHRKLIHNSYSCPKWLEYVFVYFGVQVGLAGPLGLLRQHELRDKPEVAARSREAHVAEVIPRAQPIQAELLNRLERTRATSDIGSCCVLIFDDYQANDQTVKLFPSRR